MNPRTPQPHQRPDNHTPQQGSAANPQAQQRQRDTVLSIVRGEIDSIYGRETTTPDRAQPQSRAAAAQPSTNSQASTAKDPHTENAEQWKKYHSAWQDYYQKYYEQYYLKEVRKTLTSASTQQPSATKDTPAAKTPSITTQPHERAKDGLVTQDEALFNIRKNIIDKAQTSAKKVRKSRHFVPIAAAAIVLMGVGLLQYNQVLIANVKAYMSPGNIQPQNIIVDPNADVPVSAEEKMIIPKINVDAPTVYDVGPSNEEQLAAMANGIAHVKYPGATAKPGQVGNAVYSGHSSSDWTDTGAYKFIFVQLERLAVDDVIYINHNSKRYTYKVFETKVVKPTDVGSLNYTGNDPIITLITCTPLGTAEKRLLVFAKQVSPDPKGAKKAAPAADSETVTTDQQMTGTAPTALERLFGA